MLIAETLRSSTFKVALIWIAGFGALVIALFAFVYSSTASYVLNRSDRAIDADRGVLIAAYEHGGRNELITAIGRLAADRRLQDRIYLLAAPSFGTVAGNLRKTGRRRFPGVPAAATSRRPTSIPRRRINRCCAPHTRRLPMDRICWSAGTSAILPNSPARFISRWPLSSC